MVKKYWKYIKEKYPNRKLVFIHTPKCGGSYARIIMHDLKIKNRCHNRGLKNNCINFTIIRDPIKRFESFLNFRLNEKYPRHYDWPKHLYFIYKVKNMNLNKIVKLLSTRDILGFEPLKTLAYWSKNINIFITIDELHDFLHFFGYDYDETKYNKKINVSKKSRGKFNNITIKRLKKIYRNDIKLFNFWTKYNI